MPKHRKKTVTRLQARVQMLGARLVLVCLVYFVSQMIYHFVAGCYSRNESREVLS